jgi:hypothetical protein
MPDSVKRVHHFYTEVPAKPGEGAQIRSLLAKLAAAAYPSTLPLRARSKTLAPRLRQARRHFSADQ